MHTYILEKVAFFRLSPKLDFYRHLSSIEYIEKKVGNIQQHYKLESHKKYQSEGVKGGSVLGHELLHNLRVAITRRQMEGRHSFLGTGIGEGLVLQQNVHYFTVAELGRQVKSSFTTLREKEKENKMVIDIKWVLTITWQEYEEELF